MTVEGDEHIHPAKGSTSDASLPYWLALCLTSGVGPRMVRRLLERFGDPESVCRASLEALMEVHRVGTTVAQRIRAIDLAQAQTELMNLTEQGIGVVTLADAGYPAYLRLIPDAPPILFTWGTMRPSDRQAVAVVGSRSCSQKGLNIAHQLAMDLAQAGYTVISGLAQGIDTAAHRGALEANGRTWAVLGSGIRVIHPSENEELAHQIADQGAILSELPPNARPSGGVLMARDRIVSGLSLGTIVVEAGAESGSLDTVHRARQQGRAVLAVDLNASGNQQLLSAGALSVAPHEIDIATIADRLAPPGGSSEQLSLFV